MGLCGSLRAIVLLSLLAVGCRSAEPDEKVDIDNLAHIIQFFDDNYKKVEINDKKEVVRQYAVAINVPEAQCKENFAPDQSNFLTNESSTDEINSKIYNDTVALYKGEELIAAGTLNKGKFNKHSESILMNPPESSPMTNLLNKRTNGCVVFYTYNSPCVQTCLKVNGKHSILKMLEKWSKKGGLKAFVFKDIWKFDKDNNLKEHLKEITKYVPLYRCMPSDKCYECVQEGTINPACVQFQQTRHHHVG